MAGMDWEWIAGFAVFLLMIYCLFRLLGGSVKYQLCDAYAFGFPVLDTKWIFCPPLWKLFNSYDFEELLEKEWSKWPGPEDDTPDDGENGPSGGRSGPLAAVSSFAVCLPFYPIRFLTSTPARRCAVFLSYES